jgi:RnfABCDGE-type electron transport complex B subunit
MKDLILVVVVMGVLGLVFGLIIGFANKKFAVEMNPLIHIVEDILPKGQCGACGFAGCQAYAEAVVLNKDIAPNLCIPGKKPVADKVAEITGKKAEEIEPRIAYVQCANPISTSSKKYQYTGVNDCVAASLIHSGPKECPHGCIGLGTCAKACPFNAITMNELGLPVIDKTKCTGCGKCEAACPKKTIKLVPLTSHVALKCNTLDKGAIARKYCSVACLGCGICAKQCPHGAIKIENNLAVVDPSVCREKCTEKVCLAKCPTKAIQEFVV